MTIYCALCIYAPLGEDRKAKAAETVIGGYAVCEDHLGYVPHGQTWASMLTAAKRELSEAKP
jgi:hypothetical protein